MVECILWNTIVPMENIMQKWKRGDFKRKYGYSAEEATKRMSSDAKDMQRVLADREADMIRPGKLDDHGMVYPA